MVSSKATNLYREDVRLRGSKLSAADREKLLKPYLPDPSALSSRPSQRRRRTGKKQKRSAPIRNFLRSRLHQLVYTLIHLFFGLYIRLSQTVFAVIDRVLAIVYYHHRTPELIQKDIRSLNRLPEHLSVVLRLRQEEDAVHTLMDEVAELAAWSACAGIPLLSIYERTGSYTPPC
jgi:dehydrodolichyl diphosphate syntase complex subunit NUS1